MTFLLNRLIPDFLHKCPELEYRRCHIFEYGSSAKSQAEAAVEPDLASGKGYKKNNEGRLAHKTFVIENGRWREGFRPKSINGTFLSLALATIAVFAATMLARTAQFIYLVVGVYFRTYKATFDESDKEGLSKRVYAGLINEFSRSGEDLQNMGGRLMRDIQCVAAMELACFLGLFTFDEKRMIHMELVFAEMEHQWNGQRPYDQSFRANVYRWFKHDKTENMGLIAKITKVIEIGNRSNGAFYIWMDAQPRSKAYIERLETINTGSEAYTSYEDLGTYFARNSTTVPEVN